MALIVITKRIHDFQPIGMRHLFQPLPNGIEAAYPGVLLGGHAELFEEMPLHGPFRQVYFF